MAEATLATPTNAASTDDMLLIEHLPYTLDDGIASRAAIGLIVLATDYTIEHEWRLIFSSVPGVALYHSRIANDPIITPDSLRAMEPGITHCTDIMLPGGGRLDVVAYGCTAASMAIGEDKVIANIQKARPNVAGTTPITAAIAAFDAFGARRIGVLTPYRADVNRIVADYIRARGFEVPVFGSFNDEDDGRVARIDADSIRTGVNRLKAERDVDAIFISCTSVRIAEAVKEIEADTGLPVTSSNHAMAWHVLRLAGVDDELPQWGGLFARQLAG